MDNKTIKQLIKNYNTSQLQELILKIVGKNKAAQQTLLDYCQKNGEALKAEDHALIIENRLKYH